MWGTPISAAGALLPPRLAWLPAISFCVCSHPSPACADNMLSSSCVGLGRGPCHANTALEQEPWHPLSNQPLLSLLLIHSAVLSCSSSDQGRGGGWPGPTGSRARGRESGHAASFCHRSWRVRGETEAQEGKGLLQSPAMWRVVRGCGSGVLPQAPVPPSCMAS